MEIELLSFGPSDVMLHRAIAMPFFPSFCIMWSGVDVDGLCYVIAMAVVELLLMFSWEKR